MSWMLSWEVIFCASHSFSHLKRKVVDHGNYTWELVKDWNSVPELTLVTFCAVLTGWTLVRGEDNRWGEEVVWWWQSLLVLLGETSSGREVLIMRGLQALLFLKEFLKEKRKRVENEADRGWAEQWWPEEGGCAVTWLQQVSSGELSRRGCTAGADVHGAPSNLGIAAGWQNRHRCAACLHFPLGKVTFLFMNIERCCSMVKRRWHSENHCLIIHVIKSIHTERLNKNVMWDFLKCKLEF